MILEREYIGDLLIFLEELNTGEHGGNMIV